MTDTGGDAAARSTKLSAALDGVWERVRDSVLAGVDVLEDAVSAVLEGTLSEDLRQEAHRAAHKLSGSAGTFGFPEASRVAGGLEHLFDGPVEPAQGREAAEQVLALREILERNPPTRRSGGSGPGGSAEPLILLLADDESLAERLRATLATRRFALLVAHDRRRAGELAAARALTAVIVDGRLAAVERQPVTGSQLLPAENLPDALAIVAELQLPQSHPTLLLTDADRQVDRVAAARAGIRGFLPRTTPAEEIAEVLADALHQAHGDTEHVLACDDDGALLEAVHAVLEQAGYRVTSVPDSRDFWSALEDASPDLVLLDVDMPNVDGFELCRTLRASRRGGSLPVMFLTGATDRRSVQQAFDAGADDVIAKPVVEDELRARVGHRLARMRLLRRMAEVDMLTTLSNRRACEYAVTRHLSMAERHRQPVSFALLDLDHFKQVNDVHGHHTGDMVLQHLGRLLRTRFGSTDVTARWGGEELAVCMYGMGRHDAVQRVAEVLEEFRDERFWGGVNELRVTFSAGVAEYPADGVNLHELYLAADEALSRAKRTGRDRVLTIDPRSDEDAGIRDVVCVEDDEPLAALLLQALHTRGYSAEWIDEGRTAHRRLVGPDADLHPRVVLLDVNLPALNGLDLLAELKRSGRLAHTRVVMLTGRSSESEVLAALRQGAVDHVAKPFSVPLLLERVRNALAN